MPAAAPIAMIGSSVIGGVMANKSAKKAAAAQGQATDASIQAQRESDERYYANQERTRQMLMPYVNAGYQALGQPVPSYAQPQQTQATPSGSVMSSVPQTQSQGAIPGDFQIGGAAPSPYTNPALDALYGNLPVDSGSTGYDMKNIFSSPTQQAIPQQQAPQIAREKPTIPMPMQAPTGTNMTSFQEGFDRANPTLDALMTSGSTMLPTLESYATGGKEAYDMQQALSGLKGADAQQIAYDIVESDPAYKYQIDKAEEGMLANSSATGGLRGGNIQGALAEFRPEMLSRAINQKYAQLAPMSAVGANIAGNLVNTGAGVANNLFGSSQQATGQLASMGLSAAGGQPMGNAPQSTMAPLLAQQGAVNAGAALAQGNNMAGALNTGVQNYFTAKKMGLFNQAPGTPAVTPSQAAPIAPMQMPYNQQFFDNFQNTSPYQSPVGP